MGLPDIFTEGEEISCTTLAESFVGNDFVRIISALRLFTFHDGCAFWRSAIYVCF